MWQWQLSDSINFTSINASTDTFWSTITTKVKYIFSWSEKSNILHYNCKKLTATMNSKICPKYNPYVWEYGRRFYCFLMHNTLWNPKGNPQKALYTPPKQKNRYEIQVRNLCQFILINTARMHQTSNYIQYKIYNTRDDHCIIGGIKYIV